MGDIDGLRLELDISKSVDADGGGPDHGRNHADADQKVIRPSDADALHRTSLTRAWSE